VLEVAWRGFLGPLPEVLAIPLIFVIGAALAVSYLVDRVVSPRVPGFVGTLVFPSAVTTVFYLNALVSPNGSWGNLAYTQYGNLPLVQLAAVTGSGALCS
jgi:apolipoprotein N-acyltransferase